MTRMLNEFDTFKLLMNDSIDAVDNQIIFMLYQPIIGTNAISLYLTLLQEKQLTNRINLDFNHTRLMLLLNIDKVELLNAFKKLEAFDLIVSYYYSTKSTYIYDLKRPLSADLFFKTEKFQASLLEKLGTLQFERQKYYFLKNEPELTDDFINISSTDLHDEKAGNSAHTSLQIMLNNLNKVEAPLSNFNSNLVNNFSYQNKITSNKYQPHANLEKESNINVAQNTALFSNTLNQMQNQKPEEYLLALTKKIIDAKLKTTLHLLTTEYHLSNSVINCLFEYVWFKNNKRLEPNYILKIAKTFQDNKINDINDALKHLKLAYSKSKKHSFNLNNYQQNVLWTKDDLPMLDKTGGKDAANPQNSGTMTQEEIKRILKEIDNC